MDGVLAPLREFVAVLAELGRRLALRWYIVVLAMVVTAALGVLLGRVSKPQYTSSMIVVAAHNTTQSGGLGSLSSSLASVSSSLGGLGLRGLSAGGTPFHQYLKLFQSLAVANAILKNKADVALVYGDSFDSQTGRFRHGPFWPIKSALYELFNLSPEEQPSAEDMQLRLQMMVTISEDADDPTMATISCTSSVSWACARLLTDLHEATEAKLNEVTLREAQQLAKYVTDVLPQNPQAEVRATLLVLLGSASEQIAIATLHQSTGASVVSPPLVPKQPSFPRPLFILMVSLALGFFLGGCLAWLLWGTEIDKRLAHGLGRWKPRWATS